MSVSYVDRQTLAVLAPTVRAALGMSRTQFGLLGSAFAVAYLVGAPLAGAVIDRIGARRGLVTAVLVWSAVAAAHAIVPGFAVLFAMRVALGLAEAPSFPAAAVTVNRVLPRERRSTGFGLLFTGSSIGAALAAPLATSLCTAYGWRVAFLATAVVGLAWLPLWIGVTSGAAVRDVLTPPAEPLSPLAEARPSRLTLLMRGDVLRAILMVIASAPCTLFGLQWTSQYLVDTFHYVQKDLGWLVALPPACFDLGSVIFGALGSALDRRAPPGEKRTHAGLMLGAAALIGGLALMPLARSGPTAMVLAGAALAGGGGVYALVTADVLARVDGRFTAAAGGLCAAAQSIAHTIAGPLVGKVADTTKSYDVVLIAFGCIALPVAVAWSLWPIRARAVALAAE